MNRRSLARLVLAVPLVAVFASVAPGCGGGGTSDTDSGGGACAAGLAAGELVITEFMPDPKGSDADGVEWFEVHNTRDVAVNLNGVGLIRSKVDGTSADGHLIQSDIEIPAGGYMTFGNVTEAAQPGHIDYGYASDLGSMSNTSGQLAVKCGAVFVDTVTYDATQVKDGISTIFNGELAPDAEANDDPATWCLSPSDGEPYFLAEHGSPQQPNPTCAPPEPTTCAQCYEGDSLREAVAPVLGQLVITEVMANAGDTADLVGEWFELTVTDGAFDLNCLQYGANTTQFLEDPTKAQTFKDPQCRMVSAGDVLLFSQQEWTETDVVAKISLVDNKTATNPDPGVYIAYGDTIIDEVHYPSPKKGIAWSLDPGAVSVDGNDDPDNFCLAYTPFAEGGLGTPGAENPVCLLNPCDDGGVVREAVAPVPGDIMITEVHANASTTVGEPGGEWIELFAAVPFDLNGVQLGKAADSISYTFPGEQCLSVGPGHVLLARAGETGDMLSPDGSYSSLQLSNSDGSVWIGVGGVELDHMSYESAKDGIARQVDPTVVDAFNMSHDPGLNDPPEARCDATAPYPPFDLDLGTPGAQNSACDGIGPMPSGQCTDPDTGADRDIDPPGPGELLITEFMANPKQVTDTDGEWFEIFADADFDLNGVELGKVWDPYTVLQTVPASGPCVEVKAGQFVLFARKSDPLVNGELPEPAVVTSVSLTNTSGGLFIGHGGVDLDHVAYTSATEAKATQLSAELITPGALDVTANDVELNWCAAAPLYNTIDSGTPGAANLECGGGFIDPCFDPDLGAMREKISPVPGDLVITEFLANPSGTETDREWFELLVTTDVDLNNVKALSKFAPTMAELGAAKTVGGDECLAVAEGARVLFARKADPLINGDLPPVDATFTFALANSAGAISVSVGDVVLDAIQWMTSQSEDISTQLDPGTVDPALNDDADAAPWCDAVGPGTPKEINPACG